MKKNKEALEKKKGIFIFLMIIMILLFILSIILYCLGIKDILPIIFFLILPIVVSLIIFFLSRNIWVSCISKKGKLVR